MSGPDSRIIISLRQTLAFIIHINPRFEKLCSTRPGFTPDIVVDYSPPNRILKGLPTVQPALEASLAPVTSHHALSTFLLTKLEEDSANSMSLEHCQIEGIIDCKLGRSLYVELFWEGVFSGQVYTTYRQYVHEWTLVEGS